MSDFNKSVKDKDRSDRGWIGVSPIEKNKKEEQFLKSSESGGNRSVVLATVLLYMRNLFSIFGSKSKSLTTSTDQQQILEDIFAFRKMLQILGNEDQSHNTEFTQQFSELWHNLLDDCNSIEAENRKNMPGLSKIKIFIENVRLYPPHEDHTLGYYLTKYVGNEWLPFPFMEILHQLHQQYQEDSQSSTLGEWIANLDEIILTLDVKLDLNS